MRPSLTAIILLLAWALAAAGQQAKPAGTPPAAPCKDRSVDEYLAEMHKRKRNKNPLPDCVLSFCRQTGSGNGGSTSAPGPAPVSPPSQNQGQAGESSSVTTGGAAVAGQQGTSLAYDPIQGARNADAGDSYFDEKKYRAALSRYQEALQDKPDDPALHLRLARTYEKLEQPADAYEHYDAALILVPDGPGAKPAREGMERLRPALDKLGTDLAAIHARNTAAIAASCPAAKP